MWEQKCSQTLFKCDFRHNANTLVYPLTRGIYPTIIKIGDKEHRIKGFTVIAYTKKDGTTLVNEFIYAVPEKMRAKILKEFELLADYGNELREPYTKHIGDGIFELRIKLGTDISRVMYFFYVRRQIVLTNGFIKKSQKTPYGEIELAKKYRCDYLDRERGDYEIRGIKKRAFSQSSGEKRI